MSVHDPSSGLLQPTEPRELNPSDDFLAAKLVAGIRQRLSEEPGAVGRAAFHASEPTGKLLRPMLLLRIGTAWGVGWEEVLPAAIGHEVAHLATLVHDDIIDRDLLRRGKSSVQAHYGQDRAILAGDQLLLRWFSSTADCRGAHLSQDALLRAIQVQAAAGMAACRGVSEELEMAGDPSAGVGEYLEMARLKTGALFGSACEVGGLLGGAPEQACRTLADAGQKLGVAFQILDDLKPFNETEAEAGKPATSDVRNRRPTLPVLLAFANGTTATRRLLVQALCSGPADDQERLRLLTEAVGETAALDKAQSLASRFGSDFAALTSSVLPPTQQAWVLRLLPALSRAGTQPLATPVPLAR